MTSPSPEVARRAARLAASKRRAKRQVELARRESFTRWRETGELVGHARAWVDANPQRARDTAERNSQRRLARLFGAAAGGVAAPLGTSQSYRPTPVDQPIKAVPPAVAAERLAHRWAQLRGLRKVSSKKRIKQCKTPIGQSRVGIAGDGGGAHFTGLESCANVWACPVCAPKIRASRMQDVLTAFERHAANGGGFAFLTLTIAHELGEGLSMLLDLLGGAWKSVAEQREYKDWRQRLGLVGNIMALEVTDGQHGWHPHRHVMLFTERPLSRDEVTAFESVLDELYGRWLVKQGRKRGGTDQETGRRVGVRLDYVPPDNAGRREQLGRYLTKLQAGFELTRGDLKQSRQAKRDGGRLPFDLLDEAIAGDEKSAQATMRWREYEAAMTGKSAVRFSKGLRAYLGMPPGKTDEELAQEPADGADAGIYLTPKVYRQVFNDGHVPTVLGVYVEAGAAGVLRLVEEWYAGKYVAEEGHYPGGALLIKWLRE